jgi:hypothetical protein
MGGGRRNGRRIFMARSASVPGAAPWHGSPGRPPGACSAARCRVLARPGRGWTGAIRTGARGGEGRGIGVVSWRGRSAGARGRRRGLGKGPGSARVREKREGGERKGRGGRRCGGGCWGEPGEGAAREV